MASNPCLALALLLASLFFAEVVDRTVASDFTVPNGFTPDANFFTFKGFKDTINGAPKNATFKATKVTNTNFPALAREGVSMATFQFAAGAVSPPHYHPRGSELLLVLQGRLKAGMVDSDNKLYLQELQTGETFFFPRAMVHFLGNSDAANPAVALAAFGSANAGTISLPMALFGSGIDVGMLAKSFKTDEKTIQSLAY